MVETLIRDHPDHFLVEVRIKPTNNIKVFIDGDQGISIEKLVQYNRRLYRQIEESGLFGGIAARVKKTADSYINQKLDEIEARIDRKLDEIDRRLAEWRDKEIANRIRILKITLWASVIVAVVSLIYSYIKVYIVP